MYPRRVMVVGSLPPPINGQNVQTRRSIDLLSQAFDIVTINTSTLQDRANDELSVRRRALHYLRVGQAIRESSRAEVPDVVVWHSVSPGPAGHARDVLTLLPALPEHVPLIAVVHWGNFNRLFGRRLLRPSAGRLVRRVSRFVFLTHSLADACARWIPADKRHVIPNCIDAVLIPDASAIENKLRRTVEAGHPRMILFVANMIRTKGYMTLLRSLPLLLERGEDVNAVFAGRWMSRADEREFDAMVHDLSLADRVRHMGLVADRTALARLYLNADVLALPSTYPVEAQPLSVIEALASATPVAVSRQGGLASMVIGGREARFVDPESPASIADAVATLLQPDVWPSAARDARSRFDEHYAPDAILTAWRELIDVTYRDGRPS